MIPDGRKGTSDSEEGWLTAQDCWIAFGEPLPEEDDFISTGEFCLMEDAREATGGPTAAWERPEERLGPFCIGSLVEATWTALAEGLSEWTVHLGGIMDLKEEGETLDLQTGRLKTIQANRITKINSPKYLGMDITKGRA